MRALIFLFTALLCSAFADELPKITAIFSASDGKGFSEMHELYFIMNKTTMIKNITNELSSLCEASYFGVMNIGKKPLNVILTTTGIGEVAAAGCATQVFNYLIKGGNSEKKKWNVIASYFIGTAGVSPFYGGMMPPVLSDNIARKSDGCNHTKTFAATSIGSVCLSYGAYDMNCGFNIEHDELNNSPMGYGQCFNKYNITHQDNIPVNYLFGVCGASSGSKGKNLLKHALNANPFILEVTPPKLIIDGTKKFFDANQFGKTADPWMLRPKLISHCLEATSNVYWVGAQEDYMCRARSTQFLRTMGENGDSDKDICVTAMEGFAFMSAARDFGVPALIARGLSDYDYYPLKYNKYGAWIQDIKFMNEEEHENFTKAGYRLAIEAANKVVLNALTSFSPLSLSQPTLVAFAFFIFAVFTI